MPKMKKIENSRDIEFFYEIGQLRLIKRMWRRFFQSEVANIAEHILRVAWIALAIAKKEKVKDEGKILKMALVHNIAESRTGEVDYVSKQYAELKKELAIKDMLKDTVLEDDLVDVWKEYEERKSIESKIVKDADNLDVSLELREQEIQTASDKFIKPRMKSVKLTLYTKAAKEYWDVIEKSDVHDWHALGRNRFLSGNWKKVKK